MKCPCQKLITQPAIRWSICNGHPAVEKHGRITPNVWRMLLLLRCWFNCWCCRTCMSHNIANNEETKYINKKKTNGKHYVAESNTWLVYAASLAAPAYILCTYIYKYVSNNNARDAERTESVLMMVCVWSFWTRLVRLTCLECKRHWPCRPFLIP